MSQGGALVAVEITSLQTTLCLYRRSFQQEVSAVFQNDRCRKSAFIPDQTSLTVVLLEEESQDVSTPVPAPREPKPGSRRPRISRARPDSKQGHLDGSRKRAGTFLRSTWAVLGWHALKQWSPSSGVGERLEVWASVTLPPLPRSCRVLCCGCVRTMRRTSARSSA